MMESNDAIGPVRPDALAKTSDQFLAELNQSALFMTDVDEDSVDVQALMALSYEDTPLENATGFKDRGNEAFRARKWADARQFYTRGLEALVGPAADGHNNANNHDNTDNHHHTADRQQELILREQLHANRAACQLELGNYRSCVADCAAALRLNPSNAKALFRSARAQIAAGRADDAIATCDHLLNLDPTSRPARALADEAAIAAAAAARAAGITSARELSERRRGAALRTALKSSGIRTRSTARPPDLEDAAIRLDQLAGSAASVTPTLVFPTLLLYPAHFQSDFIKAFAVTQTLAEHLSYVLPPPWDADREYSPEAVDCFMETITSDQHDTDAPPAGLVKVGKQAQLGVVLGTGRVEVVDQIVRIFVVPRARADVWTRDYKAELARRTVRPG